MIERAFAPEELPSLIEAVFSNTDEGDAIRHLNMDQARTFIDVLDKARFTFSSHHKTRLIESAPMYSVDQALDVHELSPRMRKNALKLLYKMCGRYALLPRTLEIPICYDRTGVALFSDGFADVWKGKHCGRDVAVKVLRTYSSSDLQKITGVGPRLCFLSTCRCADQALDRGSAKKSLRGKPSGIQMYCR